LTPRGRATFIDSAAPSVVNASIAALALYHSLGKLPEPESTHDFF
jgi:hypothetical protein